MDVTRADFVIILSAVVMTTLLLTAGAAGGDASDGVWLDELEVSHIEQEWGQPRARRSVDDHPLRIGGRSFERGVGTHANASALVVLDGCAARFQAQVGVDEEMKATRGSVEFRVVGDGRTLFQSPVLRSGDAAIAIDVDVSDIRRLELHVTDGGDGIDSDHADWADAKFLLAPGATARPRLFAAVSSEVPKIASSRPGPRPVIRGPRVVGTTPGRPFLHLVPATGDGPLTFAASDLPTGLSIDARSGIISGSVRQDGDHVATISVTGPAGSAQRKLRIIAGRHKLAQTPPMGWNSWNVWGTAVDAAKVRAAADALVSSGLAAHGYAYVNIDDAWEGTRDPATGEIRTNDKFGDMRALADDVHAKGLKLGIYSSPGPKTCAGYEGSFGHEHQDARTWAAWGIDYLKHDWCSCRSEEKRAPYALMREALDQADRDIVYSLCQYGMARVWEWGGGEPVRGNLWRTTGDIVDSWASMSKIGFSQSDLSKHAGPGRWNDPDMLVVGHVGWGPNLHPTKLKPIEQQTHITLWSLLAAPLLIGCDLTKLDEFTRDLLMNDEVIEVNQDPLGRAATRVSRDGSLEVWSRPLWDGTVAVGLFNRGLDEADVTAKWSDVGISGRQPVRDLWQKTDLGAFEAQFGARVPAHGSVFVKIGAPAPEK